MFLICLNQLVLFAMALGVNVDREPMLDLIASAIDIMFHEPADIFWTGKVMDVMFNGIDVDCTSENFNAKAVCTVFEGGEEKAITPHPQKEKYYQFSFFGSVSKSKFFFALQQENKFECDFLFIGQ